MLQYLNSGDVALVVALVLAGEKILRVMAPITKTTLDDEAVKRIDRARAWAKEVAPVIYTIIEQAAEVGKIAKHNKATEFAAELEKAYARIEGGMLPVQALVEADIVARGMAAADKIGNPHLAPSSK